MEPKWSSPQHQPHAMEPKSKRSSPRGGAAADAESPLSSLFNPPAEEANGKDQDLYRILYKGQSGSGQAGMTGNGKPQWSPSKGHTARNKDSKHSQTYDPVDTSCFATSVHYGGRDYYGSPANMQAAESSNEYKVDKKDPATDSHGDWWQGSFYY